jgi:2-polyprenyl-6-methoxyphenol hydroxylase-like FAD-dependent oxidoreductase
MDRAATSPSDGARATEDLVTRTALIVGAGIGGLSAGIALRQAGWNIRIFERASSPRELGFGLSLAPNAIAALRDLGVAGQVMARGFQPSRAQVRRMDGTVLKRAHVPRQPDGGPMVIALRPALHGALLEAVGAGAITPGSEAAGFEVSGERVTLRLAGGDAIEGDLLLGADGTGSLVRHVLHPLEPPPRPSGIVAVRGAVHGAQHHLGDLHGVYYLGPGVESALVRASDTGIYWFLSLARELVPAGMTDPGAILAHLSPRFDATFRAVTSATEDLRYDELVDRDPIPFWGRDRVTLLGDAAHPLLPHTGQGAAQAIVDAVTLGRNLRGDVDITDALRSYERERIGRTAKLLWQGRRTARIMKTMNPLACYARDVVVRLIPVTPIVRMVTAIKRRAGSNSGTASR